MTKNRQALIYHILRLVNDDLTGRGWACSKVESTAEAGEYNPDSTHVFFVSLDLNYYVNVWWWQSDLIATLYNPYEAELETQEFELADPNVLDTIHNWLLEQKQWVLDNSQILS